MSEKPFTPEWPTEQKPGDIKSGPSGVSYVNASGEWSQECWCGGTLGKCGHIAEIRPDGKPYPLRGK